MPRVDLALLFLTVALTVLVDLTLAIVAGTVLGLAWQRFARGKSA